MDSSYSDRGASVKLDGDTQLTSYNIFLHFGLSIHSEVTSVRMACYRSMEWICGSNFTRADYVEHLYGLISPLQADPTILWQHWNELKSLQNVTVLNPGVFRPKHRPCPPYLLPAPVQTKSSQQVKSRWNTDWSHEFSILRQRDDGKQWCAFYDVLIISYSVILKKTFFWKLWKHLIYWEREREREREGGGQWQREGNGRWTFARNVSVSY